MDDDARDNFVILSGNEYIVGFFSLSKYQFADTDVYVEQALRLGSSAHGKNISKKIIKWIGGFIKSKSPRSIFLSVSMLYERDFSRAISAEHQNRIQNYMAGSDTRRVLDMGLFAEIKLNADLMTLLRQHNADSIKVIDKYAVFDELSRMQFAGVKYVEEFGGYLMKQYWYPFLINSQSTMELIVSDGSPVLNKRATVRTLRSENVLSFGAMNPTGTSGQWIIIVDIFGSDHTKYMGHIRNHVAHYAELQSNIFNLQICMPHVNNIERTDFYKTLSELKNGPLWLTPNFVNLLTSE